MPPPPRRGMSRARWATLLVTFAMVALALRSTFLVVLPPSPLMAADAADAAADADTVIAVDDAAPAAPPAAAAVAPARAAKGGPPPPGVSRALFNALGRMTLSPGDVTGSCAMPRCGASASRRRFTVAGVEGVAASGLPRMYVIVNHRNRLPNLHRLLASGAAALGGGDDAAALADCICFVLVDYASDVTRSAADPRAVCLPPWDSSLPIPGTLGADAYLDEAAQARAYATLAVGGGGGGEGGGGGGKGRSGGGGGAADCEGVSRLGTAAALQRVASAWPGPSAVVNATPYFSGYSRAGLLTLGLSLVPPPHRSALVFLTDADMLIRRGWWEAMLAAPAPARRSFFPIVWSGCYGAGADTFPSSPNATGGREARGWWRTRGTGMAAAYMSDIVKAGGYGPISKRSLYGTEDWGLEHRLRRVAFSGGRRRTPGLVHPHHPQNTAWASSSDGMRSARTGRYQCIRAAGDPCGCPRAPRGGAGGGGGGAEAPEEAAGDSAGEGQEDAEGAEEVEGGAEEPEGALGTAEGDEPSGGEGGERDGEESVAEEPEAVAVPQRRGKARKRRRSKQ